MLKRKVHFDKTKAGIYQNSDEIKSFFSGRCLSKSMLMCSGTHQQLENYLANKMVTTRQTVFGNVVHTLILEPEKLKKRYSPYYYTKSIEGKNFTKQFVHYSDFSESVLMAKAFEESEHSKVLANSNSTKSHKECIFFYEVFLDEHVFGVKGAMDIALLPQHSVTDQDFSKAYSVFDIKTTGRVKTLEIEKKIKAYGYDIQCYMYSKFFELKYGVRPSFELLFIEKAIPYRCYNYKLIEHHYENGEARFFKYLLKVIDFLKEKGYNSKFERVKQATAN